MQEYKHINPKRALRKKTTKHSQIIASKRKKIGISTEFRQLLKQNPGLLKKFFAARNAMKKGSFTYLGAGFPFVKIGGLKLERISSEQNKTKILFKVSYNEHTFFVKEISHAQGKTAAVHSRIDPAAKAAHKKIIAKIRKVLQSNKAEKVEYKTIYRDDEKTFIASKYYDLPLIKELKTGKEAKTGIELTAKKIEEIRERFHKLIIGLEKIGVFGITGNTCFYDAKRGKIITFGIRVFD